MERTLLDRMAASERTLTFDGGAGNDSLITETGIRSAANTWSITGQGAGMLNTRVSFSGVERLTGGTGADCFVLGGAVQAAPTTMQIDGGTGDDTLDYSAFTAGVTVDLFEGTATGLDPW